MWWYVYIRVYILFTKIHHASFMDITHIKNRDGSAPARAAAGSVSARFPPLQARFQRVPADSATGPQVPGHCRLCSCTVPVTQGRSESRLGFRQCLLGSYVFLVYPDYSPGINQHWLPRTPMASNNASKATFQGSRHYLRPYVCI